VDHSLHHAEVVRPWRTATIVAAGIAAVELVLLIAAGLVLLGRQIAPDVHAAAAREASRKPAAVAPTPKRHAVVRVRRPVVKLPRAETKVLILNGNGVQGAAAEAASLAQARGYPAPQVGNAPRTGYARTLVMYAPRYRAEAMRFRRDLNLTVVAPLDGMTPAELKGAKLVEILGAAR
jgi:LytR cell envelope-related transcriptional attenuator